MPQTISTGFRALVEAAEREIETLPVETAIAQHGRDDITFRRLARHPRTSRPLKKSADWRRLSPARTGSEMMAIANVGLGDPPAAVELAVQRCAHADAANSFGSRVRL